MDIQKFNSGLLPKSCIDNLEKLYPEIRHDWEVKPIFRTETEARVSVLNEIHHPTPHAKYWQSVKEQQVHFNELVYLSFDYRRKKIELQQLELKIKDMADDLERGLLEIDIEQKQYEILCCEKIAAERVRELDQWHRIKAELIEKHKDDIDTENCDQLQLKSHTKRFIIEMFNSGPNIGAADAQNIIGKARTAINRCKSVGLWDEVKSELRLTDNQLRDLGV